MEQASEGVVWVDPPQGWMYGFPKVWDFAPSHPGLPGEEYDREIKEWFVDNGYPRSLAYDGFSLDHCRYIGRIITSKETVTTIDEVEKWHSDSAVHAIQEENHEIQ